jgi:hypothetical protein
MTFAQRRHCSSGERIEGQAAALTLRGFEVNLRDNLLATSELSFDVEILCNDGAPAGQLQTVLPVTIECQRCEAGKGHYCFGATEPTAEELDLTETTSYKFRTYKKL